jgi:hypothetical protein
MVGRDTPLSGTTLAGEWMSLNYFSPSHPDSLKGHDISSVTIWQQRISWYMTCARLDRGRMISDFFW